MLQPSGGGAVELGHVVCGGLQLNCHGLTEILLRERVEYAWLMQLQVHRITAALSTAQVCHSEIGSAANSFLCSWWRLVPGCRLPHSRWWV